jgi:hypothetical protein
MLRSFTGLQVFCFRESMAPILFILNNLDATSQFHWQKMKKLGPGEGDAENGSKVGGDLALFSPVNMGFVPFSSLYQCEPIEDYFRQALLLF